MTLCIVASVFLIIAALIIAYDSGRTKGQKEAYFSYLTFMQTKQRELDEARKAYNDSIKSIRSHYVNCENSAQAIKRKVLVMKEIKVDERKYYVELDKIHLIYEDGELVGWYKPDIERTETKE